MPFQLVTTTDGHGLLFSFLFSPPDVPSWFDPVPYCVFAYAKTVDPGLRRCITPGHTFIGRIVRPGE
jgi:hypothetical protein